MLRKKVEDGDTRIADGEEKKEQLTDQPDVRKTPKKQNSNRTFKPAVAMLDSVRRKYRKLRELQDECEDSGFSAEQFQQPETKIPYRAIGLAVVLLLIGSVALTLAVMSMTGYTDILPNEGPVVLLALGVLTFVPGFYHVRIAIYAFSQFPGYSFDDIPDFD